MRVVETDDAHLPAGDAAFAQWSRVAGRTRVQRHLRQLDRRTLHHRVAAVDQHLHRFAAFVAAAFEVGGNDDAHADPAPSQCLHQLIGRIGLRARRDHAGGDHVLHQRARSGTVGLVGDTGIQMPQVEVDRIAEQQQLHHRDANDHRQGDAVTAQLPQLLEHDRP
ncbi:hypothetical protein D3C73_1217790 [compost metagenome]